MLDSFVDGRGGAAASNCLGVAILIKAIICVVSCRDMERVEAISSALNPFVSNDWM